ncbi:MAG TPA: hypothetical protein VES60_07570 [Nakamurella sp.]|nr:hypothetical protein [Nakamurella sp.]
MDELVAQVERRQDGQLLGVLYRNGRRVQARPVGSAREGRRLAYDLLCSAVDVAPRNQLSGADHLPQRG